MRRPVIVFAALCIVVVAAPSPAEVLDQIDIGSPASEVGHNLAGWGDIQYGTLHDPPGPYGAVDDCRGIDCPEALGDGDIWAWLTLDFGSGAPEIPRLLSLRHLEGQAVDAFDLYIYQVGDTPPGTLLLSYPGDVVSTDLVWHTTTLEDVYASGPCVLYFVSTGEHWSGWPTYGQVYFDWIIVEGSMACPVALTTWSAIKAMFN